MWLSHPLHSQNYSGRAGSRQLLDKGLARMGKRRRLEWIGMESGLVQETSVQETEAKDNPSWTLFVFLTRKRLQQESTRLRRAARAHYSRALPRLAGVPFCARIELRCPLGLVCPKGGAYDGAEGSARKPLSLKDSAVL